MEEREVTPGGSEVFRHDEAAPMPTDGAGADAEAIEAHVERHMGAIDTVFHELVSPYVHLDVLQVPPTDERPCWTLVTCGTSSRPMTVPDDLDAPALIELWLQLPPDWRVGEEDDRWFWPTRLLKTLGRLPHEYGTWLGEGHTVPNGDPPEPYAPGTELCGAIVLRRREGIPVLERGAEEPIHFLEVVPLYAHEMDFKLEHGGQALLDAFDAAGIEVGGPIDPQRPELPHGGGRRKRRFGIF